MLLCVSLVWPTKFANTLSFMQNWFDDWKFMENVRNFIFGKTGLNSLFLKIISSHTHAFCSSISMFWVVPKFFFSKTVFILKFCEPLPVSIDPIYFSINRNSFKSFKESLSVSIDPTCFSINRKCLWNCFKIFEKSLPVSINRNSWIRFLKNQIWLVQTTFSKLSLSLRLGKAPQRIFCHFPPNFLLSFSLPKPVCLYYPSFCIDFHIFMHYLMVFGVIFELCTIWVFFY